MPWDIVGNVMYAQDFATKIVDTLQAQIVENIFHSTY